MGSEDPIVTAKLQAFLVSEEDELRDDPDAIALKSVAKKRKKFPAVPKASTKPKRASKAKAKAAAGAKEDSDGDEDEAVDEEDLSLAGLGM